MLKIIILPDFRRCAQGRKTLRIMNVAETYFKYGGCVLANDGAGLDELMEDDEEEEPGKPANLAVELRAKRAATPFQRFLADALSDAIVSLWPDSKAMAFPQFLAKNNFHEQLAVGF